MVAFIRPENCERRLLPTIGSCLPLHLKRSPSTRRVSPVLDCRKLGRRAYLRSKYRFEVKRKSHPQTPFLQVSVARSKVRTLPPSVERKYYFQLPRSRRQSQCEGPPNIAISLVAFMTIVWRVRFGIAARTQANAEYFQAMDQKLNRRSFDSSLYTAEHSKL
jgi:hypothetical protein